MPEYSTKLFDLTNNPNYTYYRLFVDGKCEFDDFLQEVNKNVADKKNMNAIIAYMDSLSAQLLPSTIYKHIESGERHDLYEF